MFPEFRDLISQLKTSNPHFAKLFSKHNELDQQIKNSVAQWGDSVEIEVLKKEKLLLKDQIYVMLKKEIA